MSERRVAQLGLILASIVLLSTLTILYRGSNPRRGVGPRDVGRDVEAARDVVKVHVASARR